MNLSAFQILLLFFLLSFEHQKLLFDLCDIFFKLFSHFFLRTISLFHLQQKNLAHLLLCFFQFLATFFTCFHIGFQLGQLCFYRSNSVLKEETARLNKVISLRCKILIRRTVCKGCVSGKSLFDFRLSSLDFVKILVKNVNVLFSFYKGISRRTVSLDSIFLFASNSLRLALHIFIIISLFM